MIVNNNDSPTIALFYNIGGNGSGSGSGNGCVMSISDPVPQTHGGLQAGSVISGQSPCQVLQTILFPYQSPSFTSFYIESQDTTLEVGDSVQGGVRTFKWSTSNSQNVSANSIEIRDVTSNQVLESNLENDGSEDLDIGSDKVRTSPGTYTWKIIGRNTRNQTFSRNFSVRWLYRVYWGSNPNSTLSEIEVHNLQNSELKTGFAGTYNFSNNGTPVYYYIVYPDVWGDISEWKDTDTGFAVDYTYAGTVDVTNTFGVTVTYRLLRTTYRQTANLNSQVT